MFVIYWVVVVPVVVVPVVDVVGAALGRAMRTFIVARSALSAVRIDASASRTCGAIVLTRSFTSVEVAVLPVATAA